MQEVEEIIQQRAFIQPIDAVDHLLAVQPPRHARVIAESRLPTQALRQVLCHRFPCLSHGPPPSMECSIAIEDREPEIKPFAYIRTSARLYVVVDNYKTHKAVAQWLATHPRVTLLWLPTYCPRANPIERAFGDVHDCCTRNHQRKRLTDLVADVEEHLQVNGPWKYTLSDLYYEPAVTAAVEKIAAEEKTEVAV